MIYVAYQYMIRDLGVVGEQEPRYHKPPSATYVRT